jgi:hypothetical protein
MWAQYRRRRNRTRWWFLGEQHEPPVSAMNPVVPPDPADDRIGICCSGGGIRSASFNLGALQAIQDRGLLSETRFLSAVSGGSYIAAALAMVAKTRGEGPRDPPGDDSDPRLVNVDAPPFHRGSPEEQYLRNRASYMAPTGAAKAYLVWRVLLGLMVNLLLIGAALTVVAAALSLYYRKAHEGLVRPLADGVVLGASPSSAIVLTGLGIAGIGLALGVTSILLRPVDHDDFRRFLELWSLRVFAVGLLILFLEAVVPELIDVLREDPEPDPSPKADEGAGSLDKASLGAGISVSVGGILAAIFAQLRAQIADPVKAVRQATTWFEKLAPRLRLVSIYFATAVLGPLVILAMLVAATAVQVETTDLGVQILIPLAAFTIVTQFMFWGDLNSWSLHPFYRSRLCTAFALRRVRRQGDPPQGRAEARAEGELVPLSQTFVRPDTPPYGWPTLLVCAAANVSDPGASAPGRGVTSFTFSWAEMGGPLVGGVETEFFERKLPMHRYRDFTLPAAIAMSGAAISPSMGKMTRPSIRFLMAMANVRLGVWVPNPRRMESFVQMRTTLSSDASNKRGKLKATVSPWSFEQLERTQALNRASNKERTMPRPTPVYLIKELLGWNSVNDKFLYVTDGGHYENLGLVELLRRGCRSIYCFDASGGRPLAQLGDAIAIARSELGVEITFAETELDKLRESKDGLAERPCATGTFAYTRSNPAVIGRIVYVPTVMTEELPWDVHALKEEDPEFPRHSTMDQLFTDQKFEAYRVLGYVGAEHAMNAMDPPAP